MTGAFVNGTTLSATSLNDAINGFTINAQTGTTYTLVLGDAGKLVTLSNASAVTVTIPLNSSVAYAVGTAISLVNLGAGTVTVSPTGGVTLNGTATIAQNSGAALLKTGTDTWSIVSGGLPKASVSSSTGAPTTTANGSRTSYKWTGSGSVTLTAGLVDVLLVGGGGGGGCRNDSAEGSGGGGAGGMLEYTSVYFPAGTYTVTVGAGGAGANNTVDSGRPGTASAVGNFVMPGGGAGCVIALGRNIGGGSGGGANNNTAGNNGLAISTIIGNDGSLGSSATIGGGGGGAGAAGATNGNGGNGRSSSIVSGAAVTYAGGGGAGSSAGATTGGTGGGGAGGNGAGTSGTANTGGGGGGARGASAAGNGGSGIVVLLIG